MPSNALVKFSGMITATLASCASTAKRALSGSLIIFTFNKSANPSPCRMSAITLPKPTSLSSKFTIWTSTIGIVKASSESPVPPNRNTNIVVIKIGTPNINIKAVTFRKDCFISFIAITNALFIILVP